MNWFNGEVSEAIQKAIGEKKIFIVFVRGKVACFLNEVEYRTHNFKYINFVTVKVKKSNSWFRFK